CDIPLCSDLNVTVDNCQPTTSNGTLYERLTSDRAGFDLLSTISDVINAVSCCRKCSHIVPCVMVTYHQNTGTCTLYKENTSNAAAID
ncbi:hypothetical protein MAR_029726, partial [Mya arenaria]